MISFFDLFGRFRRDERGVFAVIFGLLALVLIAASGAVVDFASMQTARSRAQTALDAAALALQPTMTSTNSASIKTSAQNLLIERIADSRITATVDTATVNMTAGTLNLQGTMTVPTAFIQLIGIRTITAHLQAEVTRSSSDLEVSVALDTTGSMNSPSTKIAALRTSTQNLVDALVQTSQTPTYSKIALVPYSAAVNVGSTYAANVRGTPVTQTGAISTANWQNGSSFSINSVSVVSGGTVTVTTNSDHGLAGGDTVYITGMTASGQNTSRVTNLNDRYYQVTPVTGNTKAFTLNGVSGSGNKTGSGGSEVKCFNSTCDVKLNGSFSSFANGDGVYVTGVSGLTNINNTGYFITGIDANNVYLRNSAAASGQFASGTAGTLTRANYGDIWYHFTAADSSENTFPVTTCAVERTTHTYDDTAPSTTKLSFHYADSGNPCLAATIMPLSSDKVALKALAGSLTAAGSTAGHIGLAWAWYMVAPNFGYLWPTASQPAAYKRANLIKAVILMTDGFFNTSYCNGVISADAGSGSGSSSDHINCNAVDDSLSQATALCTAIKNTSTGIILYTVGFDIGSTSQADQDARTFLTNCATDAQHFYQADDPSDLNTAFSAIAQTLSELRISR